MADKITPQNEDYSRWYLDVIRDAELSEGFCDTMADTNIAR